MLSKMDPFLNMSQQRASINFFKYQEKPVLFFKKLNKLYDVLMAMTMMECFY
ncbi:hypothetical protein X975_22102, partial [Stegodyphus mimosarum]